MNFKLLIAGMLLSTIFSCQETKKAKTITKKPETTIGIDSKATDIPKESATPKDVDTSNGIALFESGLKAASANNMPQAFKDFLAAA